ncbi:MAG: DNA mismatch repair protein MutS [Candidatus Gastranaerophilales bacterium]|nr:DNA mismatch repair protein MutS [Candidatus Gastranaerophilales bacterium]
MQVKIFMSTQKYQNISSVDIDINQATPMLKQFLEIKKNYQDVILLYRMGDFYETFLEDAITASKELEITLTGREAGQVGRIPMAGIPVKALDNYLPKLLEKNYKVAICEQTTDPSESKGLVEREVIKTITAGTICQDTMLKSKKNNYLAAIFYDKKSSLYGLAYVDISTCDFRITQLPLNTLISELSHISPSEILAPVIKQKIQSYQIVPEETINLPESIKNQYNCTKIDTSVFDEKKSVDLIKKIFDVTSIEAFGYPKFNFGICAAGAILEYLQDTQKAEMPIFDTICPYEITNFVSMDTSTRKNLELTETVRDKTTRGSLLWAIDKTSTNMGGRLLRNWIQQPLQDVKKIRQRQDLVEKFINDSRLRLELASLLDKVYDIERLSTKITNNTVNARDFLALKESIKVLPAIQELLQPIKSPYLSAISDLNPSLIDFVNILENTIFETPPIGIKEGNLIKDGVNDELDYLKSLLTGGKEWLQNFENTEKEKHGIKTLKVGFSKTFGFFIEVTHSNTNLVPAHYIRKQTLTNAERYITEELKNHENEVLSAESKTIDLEYKIFCDLRNYSKEFVQPIREVASAIAILDVLLSFANAAVVNNYTRPVVDNSSEIFIKDGRHAVLEQILPLGHYVTNDLKITNGNSFDNQTSCSFMILTGPNMAGKSTYMRQNALIIILAQIGSFVPAKDAKIGIVDKIFTRVGAVDDLSTGQSTFMVEMNETAGILNSATDKSFILLDEIGRGTSTYDGVAIAWSVAEHIAENIKARTIFATHYHELNVMCEKYSQIQNFRITIEEKNGEIEFLRKVVQGGASRSYGIQVAKMAGLPKSVISNAEQMMIKMQKNYAANLPNKKREKEGLEINTPQLNLFIE